MRRLSLLGEFAVRSLAMTILFATVLAGVSAWMVRQALVEASNRAVRTPLGATIAAIVPDAEYAQGALSSRTRQLLDTTLRGTFLGSDVVALKIFDREGEVLYSTIRGEAGRRYAAQRDVTDAFAGIVRAEVEDDAVDGESAGVVRAFGTVVECYAPVTSPSTGKIVAVYEFYQRYDPIGAAVRLTVGSIWGVISLASVVVYLVQLGIVRAAGQRLFESEAELKDTNSALEASLRDLESHTVGTLQALVTAVDAKDSYTASHSLGVADCALAVGRRLGLSAEDLALLEKASMLHDIGKIGVPEHILLKSAELTPEERRLIEQHADLSGRMVESVPFLTDVVPVIKHHHERWDGTGYPSRLAGEQIPLLARILAVADAYDAMTSDRPYRSGLSWYRVRQQLRRNSGTQFDPEVVTALVAALRAGEVTTDGRRSPAEETAS